MNIKDFRVNLKNKLASIEDEKLREAIEHIEQILYFEEDNEDHLQFVVISSSVQQSEKLAKYFKGTQLYGDGKYSFFKRLEKSSNRFNHIFPFCVVDPECKEVYFDCLGDIAKYLNSKRLPKNKVSFIYVSEETVKKYAQSNELYYHWVNITEYKSGHIIEI
jgi:hypothetical protein